MSQYTYLPGYGISDERLAALSVAFAGQATPFKGTNALFLRTHSVFRDVIASRYRTARRRSLDEAPEIMRGESLPGEAEKHQNAVYELQKFGSMQWVGGGFTASFSHPGPGGAR